MTQPLISILLCSYNGEKFIKEQVDSLLDQSYPNLEIIISDDLSTDGTRAILDQYRTQGRVKIFFQKENLGQSKNFEFALKQARGEFIAFADQDDIWLPEKIETMSGNQGQNWLLYSDSLLVDESGKPIGKKISDLRRMYSGRKTTGFVFSNVAWGHALMIRSELVPRLLPVPENIPPDIWIAYNAAVARGIKYIDIPLTKYRQHSSTVTKTIAEKAESRSQPKRYADFKKQLNWIRVMKENAAEEERDFYNELHQLYSQKEKGKWSWTLFFFLMKHRSDLFMFTRKKWLSQVAEIWKQSRGELVG
jgi:glycosyltransferase involved in cell wall biosynthesis